jgi:hypothetical protein
VPSEWTLERFGECLDQWIERDQPPQDVRLVVTSWVLSRFEDPYLGVRREGGFDNLWYGTVPQSRHGNAQAVLCSYWISERAHTVTCESIATLSLPH